MGSGAAKDKQKEDEIVTAKLAYCLSCRSNMYLGGKLMHYVRCRSHSRILRTNVRVAIDKITQDGHHLFDRVKEFPKNKYKRKVSWCKIKKRYYIVCPYCKELLEVNPRHFAVNGASWYSNGRKRGRGTCFQCTRCFGVIRPWLLGWRDRKKKMKGGRSK